MKKEQEHKKQPKQPSNLAKLSGVGLQMGATIFLGAYIGKWLDQKYPNEKNWFTICFTLFFVALALFNVLRQVNKINKN